MEVSFCPLNWILYVEMHASRFLCLHQCDRTSGCRTVVVAASTDIRHQNPSRPDRGSFGRRRPGSDVKIIATLVSGGRRRGRGAAQLFYLIWASGFGSLGLSGPRIHFSWRVWYCMQSDFCWAKLKSPLTLLDPYDHLYYITRYQRTRAVDTLRRQSEKRRQDAAFFPGAFLIFWQKYTL